MSCNILFGGVNVTPRGVNVTPRGVNVTPRGVNVTPRGVNVPSSGVNVPPNLFRGFLVIENQHKHYFYFSEKLLRFYIF